MADNETNYNEILYNFEIDGNTVGSSHDENDNLISQRIYEEYDDETFHAVCDIPCYPTGLFLHLNIEGPISPDGIHSLNENFVLKYYPYSGRIRIYNTTASLDITDYLTIQYIGGSCVPKTYCANGKTIFGYHDFEGKKIDDYDLKEKGYVGDFKEYSDNKILSGEGSGTIPARTEETTVWISCPGGNGETPDISFSHIDNKVEYDGYTALSGFVPLIGLKFSAKLSSVDPQPFTFNYQIVYPTDNVCKELKGVTELIFMDPNLGCFTTRKVNKNQTDEDIVRYPMYKATNNSGNHQAIYFLNTTDLDGTYDFLSTPGKGYVYQDETKIYESFTYGYMSNMPEDTKWPVNGGAVDVLSTEDDDNLSYYNHTSPVFNAALVSRYGVKGIATKAMIQDSPFAKDQEDITKGLMEGKDEKTNLLYQKTEYSLVNPYLIYSNENILQEDEKGFTSLLDQFHLMCNDKIYRIPLNGEICISTSENIIKNITLNCTPKRNQVVGWTGVADEDNPDEGTGYEVKAPGYVLNKRESDERGAPINPLQVDIHTDRTASNLFLRNSAQQDQLTGKEVEGTYQIVSNPGISLKNGISLASVMPGVFQKINFTIASNELFLNQNILTKGPFQNKKEDIGSFDAAAPAYTKQVDLFDVYNEKKEAAYAAGGSNTPKNSEYSSGNEIFNIACQYNMCLKHVGYTTDNYTLLYFLFGLTTGYKVIFNNGDQIINNLLTYADYEFERTTITSASFENAINTEILPSNSFGNLPFNAIPLFPLSRDTTSKNLDEYYVKNQARNAFFPVEEIGAFDGSSYGIDVSAQFFNRDVYPAKKIIIYAGPDKNLKTYSSSISVSETETELNNGVVPNIEALEGDFDQTVTISSGGFISDSSITNNGKNYIVSVDYERGSGPASVTPSITFKVSRYE